MKEGIEKSFEEYIIAEELYYFPIRDEVEIFRGAYKAKLPVLLKGLTHCNKTRFIISCPRIIWPTSLFGLESKCAQGRIKDQNKF